MSQSVDYVYGYHTVIALLENQPELIKMIYCRHHKQDDRLQRVVELAQRHHVSCQSLNHKQLSQLMPGALTHHQGVVAECRVLSGFSETLLPSLLSDADSPLLLLVLDGVQDPHNLGACLRSANALGVQAVIVPKDRAVGLTPVVKKVASGAASLTPLIQVTNLARTLKWLQQQGVWLVGTAADAETGLREIDLTGQTALILGNEGQGLRRLTRQHCDFLASIPLLGEVSSLNVAVATGICLYEAQRQRQG